MGRAMCSEKTISRLTVYRRMLAERLSRGFDSIHSHHLAQGVGVSAAQVRRDLMVVGYEGTPKRGYDVEGLLQSLQDYLVHPEGQKLALIGVGNLGRALLSYFQGGRSHLEIVAAFDEDSEKNGRVLCGCRCYSMGALERIVRGEGIPGGVIAVPASAAQACADRLVGSAPAGASRCWRLAPTPSIWTGTGAWKRPASPRS